MSWLRRGVSTAEMRKARDYLRRERPAAEDRWSSDDWLAGLRAIGVPERRLSAQYLMAAFELGERNGLLEPTPLAQRAIDNARPSRKFDR